MTSADVFEDDWASAQKEAKKASVGMFLAQGLKEDGTTLNIAFVQAPVARIDKFGNNKMVANVARFSDDKEATEYQKLGLLEMSPTWWKGFMSRRAKFGGGKVYQIERHGIYKDPNLRYDCDPIRDLTADEKKMLLEVNLIDIHKEGSTEASEEAWLDDFRKTCALEWERLGWNESLALKSIETCLGTVIKAAAMTVDQRIDYIGALKLLHKGDAPEKCTGVIDLDEDVDVDSKEEFF
jgi:hypothetical protein